MGASLDHILSMDQLIQLGHIDYNFKMFLFLINSKTKYYIVLYMNEPIQSQPFSLMLVAFAPFCLQLGQLSSILVQVSKQSLQLTACLQLVQITGTCFSVS